ncbi:MAG: methyltransferase domain-containing protein, partial [Alphaproteobacteria bacterium]
MDASGLFKPKDTLFDTTERVGDFAFDQKVAGVFDDMVGRSVPFYQEIQKMTCQLTQDFAVPGTCVYDLGCSTGTTFYHLDSMLDDSIGFVGLDNAAPMLEKARHKLAAVSKKRPVQLLHADLEDNYAL